MNLSLFGALAHLVVVLLITGCEATEENPGERLTACPETRPEVCTQEYKPVCAQRKDGSHKTYSNGCSSCSDAEVVGYKAGACK